MSNIKARLMKPTGLEFHDLAFEIDKEIWNFIKSEYKKKTKSEEGNLPVRYWQTHGVPLHRECWAMIGKERVFMSYSMDSEERLISVCNDDLSGCTDWYAGDVGLTPNDDLWDGHGAALYKVVNGVAVERTLEERMADWPQEPEPEATVEDYAEALARLGVNV